MITFTEKGSFSRTERWLQRLKNAELFAALNKFGAIGVSALSSATPADTGATAASWSYTVVARPGYYSVRWHNSHVENGLPIAILIQYGHGTGTGGYVQGRDYINPAIRPIFEQMVAEAVREVNRI